MITVLVDQHHPRINYTLELVFGNLLQTDWKSQLASDFDPSQSEGPVLNYASASFAGVPAVKPAGLLSENDIRKEFIPAVARPGDAAAFPFPALFPVDEGKEEFLVDFDVFSAIFYLAVEYAQYSHDLRDNHDRHDEWALYPLFNLWMNDEPLCHHYAEWLWEKLSQHYPDLQRNPSKFDYEITIDVDHPWKYRHKGMVVNMGGLAKDIVTGKANQAAERISVLMKGNDPFEIFEEIRDLCPKDKLRFFFLIDRHSPNDSRFTFRNNAYRKLISRITREWNLPGGLHPSYETYLDEEMMEFEAKALKVLIPTFDSSRQHYLRYKLPETFRSLEKLGIKDDYSLCPVKYAGFKTGICKPYKWYDLPADRTSDLTLHPAAVMDRSLQQYLQLDPLFALKEIQAVIEKVKRVKGKFIVVLHNETFSESGEWKGWKPVLVNMLEILKKEALNEG